MPERWPEIDRLFHAALDRRPEDRAAFLDAACGGDSDLRREIESLLDHDPAAARFLEQSALNATAHQIAADGDQRRPDPEVPGYTFLRTLGEGGMGVVYLAEQVTPIRRQVALKLIKHGMDSRQVIARFEAERQTLALMHHPHIAAVFGAGTAGDGRPYFVMEYVDGAPITAYCDEHRLTTRARLELFTDVCAAVQHAHQKGVIHRDLKPSNVLVSEEDGRPRPKIIDFGVAKAIERSLTGRATFTEHGTVVGTPEYMSPEQAALSPDIDTATDVYSLGVLLYELLVGMLPFDPALLRTAGSDEMRRVIRESDPPRPSMRLSAAGLTEAAAATARQTDPRRLSRELKGDLDWITLKAIEKDRRQRYQTVAEFAADIARYLADEPVVARPPSVSYRMRKFTRRYRGAVLAATAVVLALVVGLTASLVQYVRAEQERVEANLHRNEADRQRVEAIRQRSLAEDQRRAFETAARDAATQRDAAVAATDDANRHRLLAAAEASAATRARGEAEYRAYTAGIVAADSELRLNFARAARERLLALPVALRGWEWQHLFLKTDSSVVTLQSATPCAKPGEFVGRPYALSDNALSLGSGDDRVYLRRCATVDAWEGPAHTHVPYQTSGKVLAIRPGAEALVVERVGSGMAVQWNLRLIEPEAGRARGQFGPFAAEPLCADISRDGGRLAVGFRPEYNAIGEPLEDVFDVWDVTAARRIVRLAPPKPPLVDTRNRTNTTCMVAFSPDATRVASSGARVHVWRSDSGVEVVADAAQAGNVSQPMAWSRDGSRLAIGRFTGLVDILNVTAPPHVDLLDANGLIRVLSVPTTGDRRLVVHGRKAGEVLAVAFSPDGARVVSGTDSHVGVWDLGQKKLTHVLSGHDAQVVGVAVNAAGQIISADISGHVKVWPAVAYGAMVVLPGSPSPIEFAMSANGTVVGVAHTDGGLSTWRLADMHRTVLRPGTGQLDRSRLTPGEPSTTTLMATALAMSPNGRHLFAGAMDSAGTVRSFALDSASSTAIAFNTNPTKGCENIREAGPGVPSQQFPVDVMAVSPDGRSLAFKQGRCLVVSDLSTANVVAALPRFEAGPSEGPAFAFRPDGSLVLVNYRVVPGDVVDSKALIWDWRRNQVRSEVPTPSVRTQAERRLWRVVTSPDGRFVALVTGQPATVSIWDGDLQREVGRPMVPQETMFVAFSADGRRFATAGTDTTVRIWDTERLQPLLVLVDDDRHSGVAFTPDGRLVAGRSSGGFTIWESAKKESPAAR